MFLVKLHKKDGRILASVCDKALFGKKFSEGSAQLDLSDDFYQGEEKDADETGDIIRNADHVNLVGEHSVKLGIHEGVIDPSNVKTVEGIPYAHASVMHD